MRPKSLQPFLPLSQLGAQASALVPQPPVAQGAAAATWIVSVMAST